MEFENVLSEKKNEYLTNNRDLSMSIVDLKSKIRDMSDDIKKKSDRYKGICIEIEDASDTLRKIEKDLLEMEDLKNDFFQNLTDELYIDEEPEKTLALEVELSDELPRGRDFDNQDDIVLETVERKKKEEHDVSEERKRSKMLEQMKKDEEFARKLQLESQVKEDEQFAQSLMFENDNSIGELGELGQLFEKRRVENRINNQQRTRRERSTIAPEGGSLFPNLSQYTPNYYRSEPNFNQRQNNTDRRRRMTIDELENLLGVLTNRSFEGRRGRGRGRGFGGYGNMHLRPRENASYEELLRLDENKVVVGLEDFFVKNIPTKTSIEKDSENTCPICMENFKIGETISILPCFHNFHKNCVNEWLKSSVKCPTCMKDVGELYKKSTGQI